jgi:glycosyltransferase involved in cell wall biosynthesis
MTDPQIAVLIPCYNESITIADVVKEFRRQLPNADIYVFDNNSSDDTATIAKQSGAIVVSELRQGKGYVMQAMFQSVDSDIYIIVDGDGTYPPNDVHNLIAPVADGTADMVVGSRLHQNSESQFKVLNRFGNWLFIFLINSIFHTRLTDILSGYRAFNRKFVKSVPLSGGGFEIETELTIKALQRGYRVVEVPVNLTERPEGSFSKIRLVQDGLLILNTILSLLRDYKPLTFFSSIGLVLAVLGVILGVSVVLEFFETGLVPRLPSAILSLGLISAGTLLVLVGLVLHSIARRFQELDYQLRLVVDDLRPRSSATTSPSAEGESHRSAT